MRPLLAIMRREVHAYFASPIAYTVMAVFLVAAGASYWTRLTAFRLLPSSGGVAVTLQSNLIAPIFNNLTLICLLTLPALSMRLFAEERKGGTIELLKTSPITTAQLVGGKYLGTLAIYLLILLATVPSMMLLAARGPVEGGAVATSYLGVLLYGAAILAVGLFASAMTENQIVAVVLTYALFLPLFFVELLVSFVPTALGDLLAGMSVGLAAQTMARGLIDTHYLLLFGTLIFVFLFLSVQVLDSNRWS